MKNIAILGSTGSIGTNTLAIVRTHPEEFRVRAMAARQNVELLARQANEFLPDLVCIYDASKAGELKKRIRSRKIKILSGDEGLAAVSIYGPVDRVIFAMVGAAGLKPIFAALRAGKGVAIANKEPLVMAGGLLMREAKRLNVPVFPIDSEHSGLWQCLEGRCHESIKKLVLTSSGGPFLRTKGSLAGITPRQALKHPKWKMGAKITIDSATLMNKGLEVIEASNLFGVSEKHIEVLIHPEAIVHAMVEFVDGSHLAHLGIADMRLPIQYALSYPERLVNHLPTLDLAGQEQFHFFRPDRRRFPCLDLGYEAIRRGGSMPAVLSAANEIAVDAFLNRKIRFTRIPQTIEKVMSQHRIIKNPGLQDLLDADRWAREEAEKVL